MIIRTPSRRRNRGSFDPSNVPVGTPAVATSAVATNKWSIAFSVPVAVRGVPASFKVNGVGATAVTVTDAQHVLLTFAVNVAAGQTWVIGANDPAIRTANGGFVASAAGTF
jgi:hypothetical protein